LNFGGLGLNYAVIKKFDIANGPGVRVSLFVSGCRHKCKNCFNSEAWDFNYGQPFTDETVDEIVEALDKDYIEGFSLLGGEPFEPENQAGIYKVLKAIKEKLPNKTVWCYTGFDYEKQLINGLVGDKELTLKCLELIDVLVDGKFVEELKSPALLFRGSSNQRIIDVKKSLNENKVIWLDGVWERKMGSGNIYE
jgi:anaerobic ribonucleoside-triphosphate reductase activating protein